MKFKAKVNAEEKQLLFSQIWNSVIANRLSYILPLRKVYADDEKEDEGETEDEGERTPPLNYEDLIAKARSEEKKKLYPQIEDLKNKIKVLTEKNNDYLMNTAALEQKVKDLTTQATTAGQGDPQEVLDLKAKLKDALEISEKLQKQVDDFSEVDEAALRTTIEAEVEGRYEVKLYRLQELQKAGDDILVPELVVGDTKEEIDTSIVAAKTRTDELRTKLGGTAGTKTDTKTQKKPSNPSNPPDKGGQGKEFDLDYIANLDPGSKEYKEWREKAGIK